MGAPFPPVPFPPSCAVDNLALADYSSVDMLCVRYESVNFGAKTGRYEEMHCAAPADGNSGLGFRVLVLGFWGLGFCLALGLRF